MNFAIIGASGNVGRKTIEILEKSKISFNELYLVASTKSAGKKVKFIFTPHISPMFRGILSTIYVDLKKNSSIKKVYSKLKNFYKNDYFIKIKPVNKFISTNDVINTNFCHISVCKSKFKNKIIILSSIDNLIKGGAGQAVQNINNYFGFDIKKGLL